MKIAPSGTVAKRVGVVAVTAALAGTSWVGVANATDGTGDTNCYTSNYYDGYDYGSTSEVNPTTTVTGNPNTGLPIPTTLPSLPIPTTLPSLPITTTTPSLPITTTTPSVPIVDDLVDNKAYVANYGPVNCYNDYASYPSSTVATQVASVPTGGVDTGDGSFPG